MITVTGKTVFLLYLAIRLLQDYPEEPLLIIQPYIIILFYQRRGYCTRSIDTPRQLPLWTFSIRRAYGAPAEERPSCIALVEWPQPGNPPYLNWIDLLSVFASSPDKNRTGQFLGQVNPFVWGMPTWDMYELRRG